VTPAYYRRTGSFRVERGCWPISVTAAPYGRGSGAFRAVAEGSGRRRLSLDSEVNFGVVAFPQRKTKKKQVLYQGTA